MLAKGLYPMLRRTSSAHAAATPLEGKGRSTFSGDTADAGDSRALEEFYWGSRRRVVRAVERRSGDVATSTVDGSAAPVGLDAASAFDWAWLRRARRLPVGTGAEVRIADLFCGCGSMTLGAMEACRALGYRGTPVLAVDIDQHAIECFRANHGRDKAHSALHAYARPIEELLDRAPGRATSASERALLRRVGRVDLLLGGPPCQGHSDLNNHTRRDDGRNALSLKFLRFIELATPQSVVMENVPGIRHDRGRVLDTVMEHLERLGYTHETAVLKSEDLGVPQRRHRFVVAASTNVAIDLRALAQRASISPQRTVAWACADLARLDGPTSFDRAPVPSATNLRRINYLFDHDVYELPDHRRPQCHRDGNHSYKSIYGRLRWDQMAQTVTTGFRCMGQGRYVHPARRRTLTPHEAARLQFIPDFFRFGGRPDGVTARLIGNAVPPKLSYAVALELLR